MDHAFRPDPSIVCSIPCPRAAAKDFEIARSRILSFKLGGALIVVGGTCRREGPNNRLYLSYAVRVPGI